MTDSGCTPGPHDAGRRGSVPLPTSWEGRARLVDEIFELREALAMVRRRADALADGARLMRCTGCGLEQWTYGPTEVGS